jgi:hypothetical protein
MPLGKQPEPEIAAMDAYEPKSSWAGLGERVEALAKKPPSGERMAALLRVFERWPEIGGEELQCIVHALEKMPGYEARVVASMGRAPSVYAARMINRMLNVGTRAVGRVSLLVLLELASERDDISDAVRSEIRSCLRFHAGTPTEKTGVNKAPSSLPGVTGDDLVKLLGLRQDSLEFSDLEEKLGEKAQINRLDLDGEYLHYRSPAITFFAKDGNLTSLWMPTERGQTTLLALPCGLSLGMTRQQVRERMGLPPKEIPAHHHPRSKLLSHGGKDIYDLPGFKLAVTYSIEGEKIDGMQMSVPTAEKRGQPNRSNVTIRRRKRDAGAGHQKRRTGPRLSPAARQRLRDELPPGVTLDAMGGLCRFLDPSERTCACLGEAHSLSGARHWIFDSAFDMQESEILAWLGSLGGGCDCKIGSRALPRVLELSKDLWE